MKLKDFSRIENAISIDLMQKTHIVVVGAGGSFSILEGLTRSGLGKLTVIDFDTVEESNIVRQGYYSNQIGKPKAQVMREHLALINAGLEYEYICDKLENISEKDQERVFRSADLLLFLTDSFRAQAFGNLLALKYQKPAIWAGYYERSLCAEIVFTIPGVTPACFRCAVSPRYEIQAKNNNSIKASSACNTIFHSQLLDACIGMLSFAILHNKVPGYEYSGWFGKYWDRNLIQIKVHPNYGMAQESLFYRTFQPCGERVYSFNSIFQKIEQEIPPKYVLCPDCGGKEC